MFDGLLRFQISEKWANLWFPLNIQKQKVCQLQGGFAPLTPQPGALPPDLHYRLALCALAMAPPLPNPKYATASFVPKIISIASGTIVPLKKAEKLEMMYVQFFP